jgi:hypothetical protein
MGDLGKPDEFRRINFTFHRFHDEEKFPIQGVTKGTSDVGDGNKEGQDQDAEVER